MGSIFLELSFEGVALVEAGVDAEFSSDACELAEFVAEAIGAVKVPVEPLVVADVQGEEEGTEEALFQELGTPEPRFGPVLDIERRFFGIGFIAVEDDAWADVEANPFGCLIGGVKVCRFNTGVEAFDFGVVDHVFISKVAGDMVDAEAERPLVDCVCEGDAEVEVCVDEFGSAVGVGAGVDVEYGPDAGFDSELQIAFAEDVEPAVNGEVVSEGDADCFYADDVVACAIAEGVVDLARVGDEGLEEDGHLREPDAVELRAADVFFAQLFFFV